MNVFVTGGAGYVGSVTVARLIQAGHQVLVFDNLEKGHRCALHPDTKLFIGDLRNPSDIEKALAARSFDAVIHFAAYAYVGESMNDPLRYFQNNVSGSLNLIQAAKNTGIPKFIFSSSCATYGIPETVPITENTPQAPVNPYGESKQMVEKIFKWVGDVHGMETVILRYFNACGADGSFGEDHSPETHIIPLALEAARNGGVFKIFGDRYPTKDGTCIRDYVDVRDLSQAHLLALKPGLSDVFNLGNGTGFSVKEVLDTVRLVTGKPLQVEIVDARPGDPPVLVADCQKAINLLGWTPEYHDLTRIITDAWQWLSDHPSGYGG